MAERAESLNFEGAQQGPVPLAQFPNKNRPGPAERHKNVASENYRVMKDRASRSYSVVVEKSNALVTGLSHQIRTAREEHPLRIVAVAAGTAFVVGFALRAWRNQHE